MFYTINKSQLDKVAKLFELLQGQFVVILNQYNGKSDIATFSERYGNVVITTVNNDELKNRITL